ncbi:cytochrome b-c1 complex subunit 8-like [Bombyx mandarina]|uniref:Cytochrome b-c1 complex subunit 8 n=2 Tax=Bombyx TaxID=7090 RepID=A0A8R1WKG7_BOMMO|nr:cytochrome b-c1 complex subunit 8 [Bombyx mori]XP_028037604.1 cytochrome b-c1 complex subunit 8-like [Bombyx mandarina]
MGKHFGELGFIRGIVYYKMSPHEQKAYAGAITKGIPNFVTRMLATIAYWLPPAIIGTCIYKYVEEAHHASLRKDPRDFMDEVDPNI